MIVPRSSKVYDVQFKLDSGRSVERIEIFEIRRVSKSRNEGSKNDRKRGTGGFLLFVGSETRAHRYFSPLSFFSGLTRSVCSLRFFLNSPGMKG